MGSGDFPCCSAGKITWPLLIIFDNNHHTQTPTSPLDSVCTHRLRVHGMDGEERGGHGGGGGGEEEARGEGGVEQQHHGQVQGQVGGVEHSAVQPRQPHRHPEHRGVISMQGQCNQIGFLRTLEFSTFKDINFRVDMNSKSAYKCPPHLWISF